MHIVGPLNIQTEEWKAIVFELVAVPKIKKNVYADIQFTISNVPVGSDVEETTTSFELLPVSGSV